MAARGDQELIIIQCPVLEQRCMPPFQQKGRTLMCLCESQHLYMGSDLDINE